MSAREVVALLQRCEPWYDALILVFAGAAVVAALAKPFRAGIFLPVTAGVLLFARLPNILTASALQVDESAIVSNAMRALRFPIAWSGFDGFTSGPLDTYVVLPFAALPQPYVYAAVRSEGVLFHIVTVIATFFGLRLLTSERSAALATALLLFFFVGSPEYELATFTTESFPIALLAIALLLLVRGYRFASESTRVALVVAGLAGAMAFAKLQAAPIAAILIVAAIGLLFKLQATNAKRARNIALIIVCALAAPPLCVLPAVVEGNGRNVLVSYFLQSHAYVEPLNLDPNFYFRTYGMAVFFAGSLSISVVALLGSLSRARNGKDERIAIPIALCVAVTAAAVVAAYLPGKNFLHYTLFTIVPLTYVLGLSLHAYRLSEPRNFGWTRWSMDWCAVFAVAALACSRLALGGPDQWKLQGERLEDDRRMLALVERNAAPGSTTAVWGFDPGIYVATGTVMATEDSDTAWQIVPGPYRAYFRARYLKDFEASAPSVFVDDVAPQSFAIQNPKHRVESCPVSKTYVRSHYRLAADFRGVRVFVRDHS